MRTAICFSGEFRSLDKTFHLLEKNILSKFKDYDIFIFFWQDDPHIDKMNTFLGVNDHVIKFHSETRKDLNLDLVNEHATQGMFRQLYCLQQCNKIKQRYEEAHNFKYDIVVRVRPDLLLLEDTALPDNIEEFDFQKIWTLNHDDWHGLCDRFYITNSTNMDLIADGYDLLPYYIRMGGNSFYERFLMFLVNYHGIEVETLDCLKTCLLRVNGERVGELVHIEQGIIERRDDGIWHRGIDSYI